VVSERVSNQEYLAKSDCCDLCDLCVSMVSSAVGLGLFLCRKLQNTNMHFTLCFAKRHCVECFFYVETYKIPIHAPHTVSDPNRTQCGVLFICRKLQNSEAHFSTTVHIHLYTYIHTGMHYKYENRHRHICVRSHWPESTGSRSITEVKQG
jgi:hypothetical protein